MLLGIVLHSLLSLGELPVWPAQDINQNTEGDGIIQAAIHGFRMPLFVLISGFFTAMPWHQEWPGITFDPVDGGGLICQRLGIHGI